MSETDRKETFTTPSPARALRSLFLTLFLRGQSARGLKKNQAPQSIGRKLLMTMIFYCLFGCIALAMARQPLFLLSAYLHAMTFAFVGMFVAASAGEILFNPAETDILLHRPIEPRTLLWAKMRVLVEVSLWIAMAFNLAGLLVGTQVPDGSVLFPLVHAASIVMQTLFCVSCVVVGYQLCLRWFGRERLDAMMVMVQVVVSVAAVVGGQILPRLLTRDGDVTQMVAPDWWIGLVPPAWFAGIDDAIAGSGAKSSWILAAVAVASTALVMWLALVKLTQSYTTGLQTLNETAGAVKERRSGRWLGTLVNRAPLRWWLRDPVERASFLLTVAYLVRDRETKLRVYPGLAPFMVLPVVFLFGGRRGVADGSLFGLGISAGYLSMVPLLAAGMVSYSQHWQASDLFRIAPLAEPGRLCHGARRAVLLCLMLPILIVFALICWTLTGDIAHLCLLLPGLVAMPVFSLIPSVNGDAVPLSRPGDEAKAASRGLSMIGIMFLAMLIGGVGVGAWHAGVFWWFLLVEAVVAAIAYFALCRVIARVRWRSAE